MPAYENIGTAAGVFGSYCLKLFRSSFYFNHILSKVFPKVSEAPIYMCPNLHQICSGCQPRVERCPECRENYPGRPRRHRYAEKAAEELAELIREKADVMATFSI